MSRRIIFTAVAAAAASIGLNVGNDALAADRFGYCGVVNAYAPPTQSHEGSVTVGSRTFRISAGVTITMHPIELGTKRCLAGDRDGAERFTSLNAQAAFLENITGTVSQFKPATATARGSLVLNGYLLVLIRPGTQLPADSASGHRSFTLNMDSAGDTLITGRTELPPGWAAAATGAPVARLPATSTSNGQGDNPMAEPVLFVLLIALVASAFATARSLRPTAGSR